MDDEKKDNEPHYDDYISQSENDEEGYDVLDTFESEVNCQNVAFFENMNPIFSGSQRQILVDSQEEINIWLEDLKIHESPEYISFVFYINNEESDQIIANCSKNDFEVEDLEHRSFVVKEEVDIFPYVYEKKKKLDTSCPSPFVHQQGKFNYVFQYSFASLLEISEQEVLRIYLGIISEHNFSENMSFEVRVKFMFVLSSQRPFILIFSTSI